MDDYENTSAEAAQKALEVMAWNDWLQHSMTDKLRKELKDRREQTVKYAVHSAIADRKSDAHNALIKIRALDEVIEYVTPVGNQ